MQPSIRKLSQKSPEFPKILLNYADPPQNLYVAGQNLADLATKPKVAIVGSRKPTLYGRHVTEIFAAELARAGVVIISGLALGIDSLAHKACLGAGGQTIAVLPASLKKIYPASHHGLGLQILKQGGALLTEYEHDIRPHKYNFVARNRIIAGLADVVLVTEAAQKSGSLHTAQFALEQGIDVFAIPGNINNHLAAGTNGLIKSGAGIVTSPEDVLFKLGVSLPKKSAPRGDTPQQQLILDQLAKGNTDGAMLLINSKLDVKTFSQAMTMLEIKGNIKPLGNDQWSL